MKNKAQSIVPEVLFAIVLLIAVLVFVFVRPEKTEALSGVQSFIASSSVLSVGPHGTNGSTTAFTRKDSCGTRVISTIGVPLMLSFDLNILPSAAVGHIQASSTSKEYPSDQYGCGPVRAWAVSTTSPTITEFSI